MCFFGFEQNPAVFRNLFHELKFAADPAIKEKISNFVK